MHAIEKLQYGQQLKMRYPHRTCTTPIIIGYQPVNVMSTMERRSADGDALLLSPIIAWLKALLRELHYISLLVGWCRSGGNVYYTNEPVATMPRVRCMHYDFQHGRYSQASLGIAKILMMLPAGYAQRGES